MGTEVYYHGSSEFRCPNCDETVEVEYQATEYPIGVLDFSEANATGGVIVKGFGDIDIDYGEEVYSYDEEIELYIPKEQEIIQNLSLIHI